MTPASRHVAVLGVLLLVCAPVAAQAPGWAIACGDGRVDLVVDDFDQAWSVCCTAGPQIPPPTLRIVDGCDGAALAVDYDLRNTTADGQSWVVLVRKFDSPLNLSGFTHLRLAIRGSNLESHETVDVKLWSGGRRFTTSLRSMTDLPVWRPIYIDFREFTGSGPLNLASVEGLELGIARCDHCEVFDNPEIGTPEEHQGTLFLDELAAVDLRPGGAHRVVQTAVETVPSRPAVRSAAAAALLARVDPETHLVPAWFPEATKNFNVYVQAVALLVFVYEYEIGGQPAFRDAARRLADRLIALQIPAGKRQAGAWYAAYFGSSLTPPHRALPSSQLCDGDEDMVEDPGAGALSAKNIDACEWVGNVGWALVALDKLRRSGFYDDRTRLDTAIERAAAWVIRQPGERGQTGYPGLVSLGVEGNISGYFGLMSAGTRQEAAALGNAIFQFGWDPVQRRMKAGARPEDAATAIDVSGSWGAVFLRATGRYQEALDAQGYSASILRAQSFDGAVAGYGDIAGPYTPAVEFAAQAVVAGIKDASFVVAQLVALQRPAGTVDAGAFPGAPDHWYGGPLNPWITTMPGVSPTAWMYLAVCCDPLMAYVPFSDDPLVTGSTLVRATHVLELRARIDALRVRFGLLPVVWSGGVHGGGTVAAAHMIELRTALTAVYAAAGHAPPIPEWIDPTLAPGVTAVKAAHLAQLRSAVIALE